MKKPEGYDGDIERGDAFIQLKEIRAAHVGRVFVARDQRTGAGYMGPLDDVTWYMLQGTIGLRFKGQKFGLFDVPEAQILLKHPGFVWPLPEPHLAEITPAS